MKVSIIIPCHNAERYLAQTIGSVLEQNCPAHEIIVVDDGSEDGSLDIALRFAAALPERMRVIAQRSGSASRTRNIGAFAATGDALMFLDADDVLGQDALDALTNALSRKPDAVAVCPWYRLEQVGEQWVRKPPSCAPRRSGQDPLSAWLTGWYHPPCSVLWSKAAFERAGRWDEQWSVNDDGDLMMRALASGTPLIESPSGAAYYRRLPEGETSLSGRRTTPAGLQSRLRPVVKLATWLEERGTVHHYRPALRRAFELIAADARGRQPQLCEQAEARARGYAPPICVRATHRLRRLIPRPRATAPRKQPLAPEAITHGLTTATRVISMSAPSASSPRDYSPPPRPAVTVLIPTYNRADLLPRAIDGVLAQTFADFDILVVDDGSTDDTPGVVARYAQRDPRVKYLRQPHNAGVGAARNRGLREARGEFVAFLDSDDEWMPQKLALQMAQFAQLPEEVGLIYTGVETVSDGGMRTIDRPAHRGDVYPIMLCRNVLHGAPSGGVIRRNVIATAGFFDEDMPAIEDYDYWLRVTRFFKVDYIDAPLIRYHDPRTADRRSLSVPANLAAREWLYRKHKAEMRRVGAANTFLRESIRRALAAPRPDVWAARRIAARALVDGPSREALGMFRRTLLASSAQQRPGSANRGLLSSGWSNA
ncbi:MAG TPA: glycosyltransferase family A protein [Tepidisphaeraceae bacterium]|nr:glycosyltransferase family A protein [Tepidisphaeraceae bacterium]